MRKRRLTLHWLRPKLVRASNGLPTRDLRIMPRRRRAHRHKRQPHSVIGNR